MRGLVHVDCTGELEVRRDLYESAACESCLGHDIAATHFHEREEEAEVVLDPSEIHLVQDQMEVRSILTALLPSFRCLVNEFEECRWMELPVERVKVAEQVLVRGPIGSDRCKSVTRS